MGKNGNIDPVKSETSEEGNTFHDNSHDTNVDSTESFISHEVGDTNNSVDTEQN